MGRVDLTFRGLGGRLGWLTWDGEISEGDYERMVEKSNEAKENLRTALTFWAFSDPRAFRKMLSKGLYAIL